MRYSLSEPVFNEVMNLVASLPYGQVAGLITEVRNDLQEHPNGEVVPLQEAESA